MEDEKKEKEGNTTLKFDDLMQDFSQVISKRSKSKVFGKDVELSEDMLLQTSFPMFSNEPLEKYLCICPERRLDSFYHSVRPFHIVIGKVTSISASHISVCLLYVIDGQKRFISDLNVTSNVVTEEVVNKKCFVKEDGEELKNGDKVKGVVVHVNQVNKEIEISFDEKNLSDDQVRFFPLGKLSQDEEDNIQGNFVAHDDLQYNDSKTYICDLESSSHFIDPHSIKRLLNTLHLPEKTDPLLDNNSTVTLCDSVEAMREKQSAKWSMDMVGVGVKHFREQRLKEAMKCFDQSISFYSKNAEAYVARGALKANKNELSDAVQDFRQALRLNPHHRNAKKYLIETLSNIAKRYEKEMKWKDASRSYKDILDIDADNKDAFKQYNHIKVTMLPKKDDPQIPQHEMLSSSDKPKTLSVKSKERINKLKELLSAETTKSPGKGSSSSSSSSSSDSESSSDEGWVEKKDDIWVEKTSNSKDDTSSSKRSKHDPFP